MIERPPPRQRAIDADEKAARREAILDAAERLYAHAQVLPGVAEVAVEVGLAKGTMYLYFESKEALYLGLHHRHSQHFFDALIARLAQAETFDMDAMLAIVDEHMIRHASFLPLSNACMGAAPGSMDEHTHEAFHIELGGWLARAGAGLEQRLPRLRPGDGMRFLHHGYAMLLGLYQLLGQPSQCAVHARVLARLNAEAAGAAKAGSTRRKATAKAAKTAKTATTAPELLPMHDFRAESHAALRGLWRLAELQGVDAGDAGTTPLATHLTAPRATTAPTTARRPRTAARSSVSPPPPRLTRKTRR